MTQTPKLADVIQGAIDASMAEIYTAMPASVTSYSVADQSAYVQPLIKMIRENEHGDRVAEMLPVIPKAPVIFPGSGPFRITWPIAKGDIVLVVCSHQSLDKWLARGGLTDPLHHEARISDAVVIPGLHSFGAVPTTAPTDAMVMHSAVTKIGSPGAAEHVMRGDTYKAYFHDFKLALEALANKVDVALTELISWAGEVNAFAGGTIASTGTLVGYLADIDDLTTGLVDAGIALENGSLDYFSQKVLID